MTRRASEEPVRIGGLGGTDFDRTLFGGQTFRWTRLGETEAEGWIRGRPVHVAWGDDAVAVSPLDGRWTGLRDAAELFFDVSRDYARAERRLRRDARIRHVATGLRILRQDEFETAITFIVSANNNIPRIAACIERLCELAGRAIPASGRTLRRFPEPGDLAAVPVAALRRDANLGYRDRYVAAVAERVAIGVVDLREMARLRTPDLVEALRGLPGVGPKVADCIALFGYGRLEVFPVDTWVRRAYSEVYLAGETASDRAVADAARARWGPCAGLAQQYLFEWVRRRPVTSDRPSRDRASRTTP